MAEQKNYQMYINGEWVAAQSGKTFESINPSDGKPWAVVPEADEVDVDTAVKAAHRAFTEGPWPTMTATERGKLLRRLGDVLAEHSESLGHCETVDPGQTVQRNPLAGALYLGLLLLLCRPGRQGQWRDPSHRKTQYVDHDNT
ncbi:MAG: hypothetical protein CM1200mP18_12030 [Gammaproteobacteria bacterium]|nr:MAG: hypothetical protein CM1200mP18_12030 [Gammaproteobacteria bacterium]